MVVLRPWTDADLDDLVRMHDDPDVARFTPLATPYTATNARRMLDAVLGRLLSGEELALAVEVDGGGAVGSIGVRPDDLDREVADVGYVVAADARGRGIATRAVRLVAAWALAEWRLARLQLTMDEANAASARVAQQAGFTREGVLRSWAENRGRRVDLVMWSQLPGDR
jgi:RimJ/RimL family protein N-acetyltransferase